jgi:hypothetical protein
MKKSAFYVCAVFSKAKKRLSHDVSYLSRDMGNYRGQKER